MKNLVNLIETAVGRKPADLVLKNCRIVNVYTGAIESGDIAITDRKIVGIGEYDGEKIIVPCGTTTIIADPHEIANVCGLEGLRYMLAAAKKTKLNIIFAMPSCVPATDFEDTGAIINAEDMEELLRDENIFGLGEFMNAPGVINCDERALKKIALAKKFGKLIDGHAPNLTGKNLNAYVAAGILGDHECMTVEEMQEKISRGMYILIREGSACHNLRDLLKGVTARNSRRILLCSDDRQPKTIFDEGHIDNHLRICVEEGLDAVTAIQMATLNTTEAFRLFDRGAIKPGNRADIVLLNDLKDFSVAKVFIGGGLVAENGRYLPEIIPQDILKVRGSVRVKNFSAKRLKMNLKSNKVNVIGILPGGVVTKKLTAEVNLTVDGDFVFDSKKDICKIAVIERHHETGKIGLGLLSGYGIKAGAVAISVAHDSHNIITAGVSNEDMAFAVEKLIEMEGGMVLVKDEKVVSSLPLPIAGIMSDQNGEFIAEELDKLHEKAHSELVISKDVEPVMTLTFMSLSVIPEIKLTNRGLFDYEKFNFIDVEV